MPHTHPHLAVATNERASSACSMYVRPCALFSRPKRVTRFVCTFTSSVGGVLANRRGQYGRARAGRRHRTGEHAFWRLPGGGRGGLENLNFLYLDEMGQALYFVWDSVTVTVSLACQCVVEDLLFCRVVLCHLDEWMTLRCNPSLRLKENSFGTRVTIFLGFPNPSQAGGGRWGYEKLLGGGCKRCRFPSPHPVAVVTLSCFPTCASVND